MTTITTFPLQKINQLLRRARKAAEVSWDGPNGWTKSDVDPMNLLKVFSALQLRPGFILRAYQFRSGGNGNGIIWALPVDAPFPEPDACSSMEEYFLAPPCPLEALPPLEVVSGDGSPWSYLSASLFTREADEFGALWHGCNWSTHTMIDHAPWDGQSRSRDTSHIPFTSADDWEWLQDPPAAWQPQASLDSDRITVSFYTYSGYGQDSLYRHTDVYRPGNYVFERDKQVIARGEGGYIF